MIMRAPLLVGALVLALQPARAQELRPPSPALEAAMTAGDPAAGAELAALEVEGCFADAGPEPAAEFLAPCAMLVMVAAQLSQQAGLASEAIDFGEAAANLARATLGKASDIEAYARLARGQALLELNRNEEAGTDLDIALTIARQLYAPSSPDLTPFLGAYGLARFTLSDSSGARALFEEALPLETDPIFAAGLRLNYARVLHVEGEYEASLDQARRATNAFAELVGENSGKAIEARIIGAAALNRLDRPDEAIAQLTPAIALLETRPALEWMLIDALRTKALALDGKFESSTATDLLERVAALTDRVYGADSDMRAQVATLLEQVRANAARQVARQNEFPVPPAFWEDYYAGRFVEAAALLDPIGKACIDMYSPAAAEPEKLGPCLTLVALGGLTYSSLNRLERGRGFADLAVAIAEASFDDPSEELGLALFVRGAVLQQGLRIQASIAPLDRALTMLEEGSEGRFATLQLLATAVQQAGDPQRSLALIEEAKAIEGNASLRLNVVDVEAQALVALGRADEAEALLRDSLADNPEALPTTRLKLKQALGQVLTAGRRYDEAITVLEALLPQMRATFGEHPLTARTLDALGLAYVSAGRARDAIGVFRQGLTITRALVGDDNPLTGIAYNNLGQALLRTGEGGEAARSFIAAVEILQRQEPVNLDQFAVVALNLGQMTELLDRPEVALHLADNILRVVKTRPDSDAALEARVRASRASALFALGRYDEAVSDAESAWVLAQDARRLGDLAAGIATTRARAEAARGATGAAREWFGRAAARASQTFTETDANRLAILYLYSAFEREAGTDLAAARSLLREAVAGSLARIDGYDDFDAAAQREMRSLGTLFRDQVAIAWEARDSR